MPAMRTVGIIAASVIALLVAVVVIAGIASRPQTPTNQNGPREITASAADTTLRRAADGSYYLPPNALTEDATRAIAALKRRDVAVNADSVASEIASNRAISNAQSLASPAPETVVPVNSQIIFDSFPESAVKGELTVINGASRHAVAKLIDIQIDTKVLLFAVCAGKQSTITSIPDGSYRVIFALGDRLYAGTDRFESPRAFSKFDRPFTFTTTATDAEDGTYTTLSVTLTPVVGGNITTSGISRSEFEKY